MIMVIIVFFKKSEYVLKLTSKAQRVEAKLNKISNNINKTYTGLISLLQGF